MTSIEIPYNEDGTIDYAEYSRLIKEIKSAEYKRHTLDMLHLAEFSNQLYLITFRRPNPTEISGNSYILMPPMMFKRLYDVVTSISSGVEFYIGTNEAIEMSSLSDAFAEDSYVNFFGAQEIDRDQAIAAAMLLHGDLEYGLFKITDFLTRACDPEWESEEADSWDGPEDRELSDLYHWLLKWYNWRDANMIFAP